MPTSPVEIANAALHKLGKRRITSFVDSTKESRVANDTYDDITQAVLEDHPWDFAMVRKILTEDTENPPEWGYLHAFDLPNNCLRVWEIDDDQQLIPAAAESDWVVEGRRILLFPTSTRQTESAISVVDDPEVQTLGILYIRSDADITSYSAAFVEALATRLAFEWAETLNASDTQKAGLGGDYAKKVADARATDSQQGRPPQVQPYGWLLGRFG